MAIRTGAAYVAALRDGRQVWQGGRRIEDVPSHPGFAGTVATLAGLYDRQHDPAYQAQMTATWAGQRISLSYFPPTTMDELLAKRRNVEVWAEQTFGFMGRFPDFCSGLTVGLLDAAEVLAKDDPRWGQNARDFHYYAATHDLCLTHALNDQFYDRSKRVAEQPDPDLILHVVRETADGPIVRGVRNLATLAPLSDEVLVHPNRPRAADEADYALAFALPMNAPGLTMICRDLYGEHADPERLPLSARFDEVDATLVFDDVLVPWERLFVYRNPVRASQFHGRISSLWAGYSTLVRLGVKLDVFIGLADLLSQWAGRKDRTVQVAIGQLLADREILRACLRTAEVEATRTAAGFLAPRLSRAYRVHGIEAADRAVRLLQDVLTSSAILTGGASDLGATAIGPYVERFFRNNAPSTRDHVRLLAIAADAVLSSFAGRNQLYERLQSGEPDNMRAGLYSQIDRSDASERLQHFIQRDWDAPTPTW